MMGAERKKYAVDTAFFFTLAAMLWLAVFPLWQGGDYSHITEDKRLGMIILTALSVSLCCAGIFCRRMRKPGRSFSWREIGLSRAAGLLFFSWMVVSALFGTHHSQLNSAGEPVVWAGAGRYEGLSTQICYALIFLFLSLGEYRFPLLEKAAAGSMLLFLMTVLSQYAGVCPIDFYPEGLSVYTSPHFVGTIGNIDMVSGYAVMISAFLAGRFLFFGGKRLCYFGTMAGIFLLCCIDVDSGFVAMDVGTLFIVCVMLLNPAVRVRGWLLLAGADMCFLLWSLFRFPWETAANRFVLVYWGIEQCVYVLFLILCTTMCLIRMRRPGRAWSPKTVLSLFLLFLIFAMLLLCMVNDAVAPKRGALWELRQILHGKGEDWFGNWRYGVWRLTLQLLPDHLLFGSGPDTFWYVFKDTWANYEAELEADGTLERLKMQKGLERFYNPHNEYLAILSNNGLPGLVFYLLMLGSVLYFSLFRKEGKAVRASGFAVLLYQMQGFFSFSNCLVSPIFWAMLGITVAEETNAGCAGKQTVIRE